MSGYALVFVCVLVCVCWCVPFCGCASMGIWACMVDGGICSCIGLFVLMTMGLFVSSTIFNLNQPQYASIQPEYASIHLNTPPQYASIHLNTPPQYTDQSMF